MITALVKFRGIGTSSKIMQGCMHSLKLCDEHKSKRQPLNVRSLGEGSGKKGLETKTVK
jgi:hypothetical protein